MSAAEGGFWSRLLHLRVAGILAARYVELKLGQLGGTLLLLAQAPLIGYLVALAFDGQNENPRLQFVLAMVAVWFGTFNACREVVKERGVFLRERRIGVTVRAYLVSKLGVLAFLAAVQSLLLVIFVARAVRFDAARPAVFLALFVTALAATCLGLMLSSMVTRQDSLIALVPLALIPQLIFSDLLLPHPPAVVELLQGLMPADRSLDVLRGLRQSPVEWTTVAGSGATLVAMGLVFLLLAGVFLRLHDE